MNMAQQDVRDRLDLFEAPSEVTEKPVILRYDPGLDPVLCIAITGPPPSPEATAAEAQEQEQRDLTRIREVCRALSQE